MGGLAACTLATPMPRIAIAYFDAGGGHRAAAKAISAILSQQPETWEVDLFNLQQSLDALDPMRRLVGVRLQDVYNAMLNRGYTRIMRALLPVLHGAVRLLTPVMARRLAQYWDRTKPDIVLSVVPNLNRGLALSAKAHNTSVPFVTLMTDLADTPPHFWIEEESEYLICGTTRAEEQARRSGHPAHRVFRTSGMVLHPAFYEERETRSRDELRRKLGLSPEMTTILVMFGGQGSEEMLSIAEALDRCSSPIQVAYICGRNERLCSDLKARPGRVPRVVTGFTSDVPSYMAASDLMIGKPGPGSISEALHYGLPVIVSRNSKTMPQEVFNTHWVEDQEVGIVVRDFRHVDREVDAMLSDGRMERMKRNAQQIHNRAIFEIPGILRMVLAIHRVRCGVQENAGVGAS